MNPLTYAIVCNELPDRKRDCINHLASRGLNWRGWRGIHGKTWGIETTREYEPGKRISAGHTALNLNHWTLWNHLVHTLGSGDHKLTDVALVVEDDAVFPLDWRRHFDQVFWQLEDGFPDWEFVFVGLAEAEPGVWNKVTERIGMPDSRLCRLRDPFGTHAYLVRQRALPKLIDAMTVAERNMDQQLYQRVLEPGLVKWCAVLPTIVRQRTFDYDGHGVEWRPSCIDAEPVQGVQAPPLTADPGSDDGPTPPEIAAATLAMTDPLPCIFRGELLESDLIVGKRAIPVSQCARLGKVCHTTVGLKHDDAESCEACELRQGMSVVVDRPRLPVPDGHFNPSMALWNGRIVLATRDSWGHSKVALWDLTNSKLDWTGKWHVQPIGSFASDHPMALRLEDPRLFVAPNPDTGHDHLHAMFSMPDGYPPKYVQVGYVRFSHDLSRIEYTAVFKSPHGNVYEKNWVPFADQNGVHWIYATKPRHVVLAESYLRHVSGLSGALPSQSWETDNNLPWWGGVVRGGACPVLVRNERTDRDEWYHFFHGCLKRPQGSVYTVGCTVFSATPPYEVIRQTPKPLAWPDLPAPDETVVKRYVLWPGGAIRHAGHWHLACGIDDTNCRIIRLPISEVEAALSDIPETDADRATSIRNTEIAMGVKR